MIVGKILEKDPRRRVPALIFGPDFIHWRRPENRGRGSGRAGGFFCGCGGGRGLGTGHFAASGLQYDGHGRLEPNLIYPLPEHRERETFAITGGDRPFLMS